MVYTEYMRDLHVIFGMGPVGRSLATQLIAEGARVRIVTRKGLTVPGAEAHQADANDPKAAIEASKGASVVYNCTNVDYTKWADQLPVLYRSILNASAEAGAKFVYTDNLYMYGRVREPMKEGLPNRPEGPKGAVRDQLADEVLKVHNDGKIPTVIVRGSDFYGPHVDNALIGSAAIKAMLANKAVPVIGNPNVPHSFTYVPDLAAALRIAGQDSRADGKAWHAPTADPTSSRSLIDRFGQVLGVKPKLLVAGRPMVTVMGLFNPLMRELKETLYQWENAFVVDSSAFQTTFGLAPTPLQSGVAETCRTAKG